MTWLTTWRYDNCYPRIDGTTNIGGTYIDFQVTDPHELGNQLPKWPEHLHGVYWQHAYVLVYYQHIFLGFFSSGVGRALSQSLAGAMVNSVFDWCYLLSRILKDDQEFDWGTDPRTQRRRCATQWWPRSSPLCETSGTSPLSSVPGVSAMWRLLGEGWGICGGPARTSPTPGTACSGTLMSTMRWDISKLPAKFLIWPRSFPGAIQAGGSSRTRKWMELPWWALRWQSHHYNDD